MSRPATSLEEHEAKERMRRLLSCPLRKRLIEQLEYMQNLSTPTMIVKPKGVAIHYHELEKDKVYQYLLRKLHEVEKQHLEPDAL